MIRKAALQIAAYVLLAFIGFSAYLAIAHLENVQKSTALTLETSRIQSNIAEVGQDLTDMETGQRGYLLTEDPTYLQPYTDAKGRIGAHFASLRSGLTNRPESERSLEAQLESSAASMQAEAERTIGLRQQGYRHRAFQQISSNEGKNYMDGARSLLSSLSSTETSNLARFETDKNADLSKAVSETILAYSCLLVLTAFLFWLTRYHSRAIEREAAESKRMLSLRDSQLEKLTSALSIQIASQITNIAVNARSLLEKYGSFLPRQGNEFAEEIKEAATQMEQLRKDLLDMPSPNIDQQAA